MKLHILKKCAAFSLPAILFLSGCGVSSQSQRSGTDSVPSMTAQTEELANTIIPEPTATVSTPDIISPDLIKAEDLTIITGEYAILGIHIQYPQISGYPSQEDQDMLNLMIKMDIWNKVITPLLSYYSIDMIACQIDYEIVLQEGRLLSILYTGEGTIEGGQNQYEYEVITIDINKATKLKVSDFVTVDMNWANRLLNNGVISPYFGLDIDDIADYVRQEIAPNKIVEGLNADHQGYDFYLTSDALVIRIPVMHAYGDYASIALSGSYAEDYQDQH